MCTTRTDMGVQEVMHLLLQSRSVVHHLEFVRPSTQCTDVEMVAGGTRRLAVRRDLLHAHAARHQDDAWARGHPDEEVLQAMPYSEFAATFNLNRGGKILPHSRRNRVVSFRPCRANLGGSGMRTTAVTAWSSLGRGRVGCTTGVAYPMANSQTPTIRCGGNTWWKLG